MKEKAHFQHTHTKEKHIDKFERWSQSLILFNRVEVI